MAGAATGPLAPEAEIESWDAADWTNRIRYAPEGGAFFSAWKSQPRGQGAGAWVRLPLQALSAFPIR